MTVIVVGVDAAIGRLFGDWKQLDSLMVSPSILNIIVVVTLSSRNIALSDVWYCLYAAVYLSIS